MVEGLVDPGVVGEVMEIVGEVTPLVVVMERDLVVVVVGDLVVVVVGDIHPQGLEKHILI